MTRPGPYRLATGGSALDRQKELRFRFDRRELSGFSGDTVASALLGSGVRTVSRSFKFHRPRGIYTCGMEEPNALVRIGSGPGAVPSARAPWVELRDGLEISSQSGWPGVRLDLARVLDFTAPLWAAGFYNKAFMWPNWHTYEWLIRRLSGLGEVPQGADPDRYDVRNLHCDVLIVGAGIAGLREAQTAAQSGQRVVLVERAPALGGRGAWDGTIVDGAIGSNWVTSTTQRLEALPDVKVLRRTTAVGYYDRDVVTLVESVPRAPRTSTETHPRPRERYWIVRAKQVILATGAVEQPLIFSNNDRPGIMLAGAAHEYLQRFGVVVGRRVLLATNNDSAYAVARDLKQGGVEVLGIADTRHDIPSSLLGSMAAASVPVFAGTIPVETSGFAALKRVTLGRLSDDLTAVERTQELSCDALAISGGWSRSLELYSQAGGKLSYCPASGGLRPATAHPLVTVAEADPRLEYPPSQSPASQTPRRGIRVSPVGNSQRQWVDLRHDVTVADLELAVRENYRSVEHVKRYTTVGMSVDQGKTSNVAAIEIVARLRGVPPEEIGHTTLRPPVVPVTLGAIVGRSVNERFAPERRLPAHAWHVAEGAVVEDFGEWKRPAVYLQAGETRSAAVRREARAVRTAAGIFDGSPLGKIEVQGPDAREFLDRFYINDLSTLQPGRARYGLMLRESGVIFDDGTIVMLAPDHFLITTTSGNANRVYSWLEEWHQCEWPDLRVAIMPVTEQWATLSVAGPRARDILLALDSDIELSPTAFPHLAMRSAHLQGVAARVYRVSFTGELTYEINVPAGSATALWQAILNAGKPYGVQPIGIEAVLLLRLEKGFLHVGTDTDGTSVPADVGWGKVAASKQADFIGKRSLLLPENVRADRLQLIGLRGEGDAALVVGSHLRLPRSKEPTDGWVTSAGRAVLTGEPIALALVRGGRGHVGTRVSVHESGTTSTALVVSPPFFDPPGDRMNA